jgi:hypothetical protein
MPVYKYKNHEDYVSTQVAGNKKKLSQLWAQENDIEMLSRYIKENVHPLKFGLCHGTRRGKEQEWFGKYLGIEVLGTEISPTATDFPNTIMWDFHEVKPEWVGAVDFIFSNSFDHSYDPAKCIDSWVSCLSPNGICIIEWYKSSTSYTKLDPYASSYEQRHGLLSEKHTVVKVLDACPDKWRKSRETKFFIVKGGK